METVKVIREPGYLYDLIFTFIYHFNKEYCLTNSNFINKDKEEEDQQFYNSAMSEFSDISDDLLLFFQRKDNGVCFFSQYCFSPYSELFASEYDLLFIQKLLFEDKKIMHGICEFYFPDIAKDKIAFYCDSVSEMGRLIDGSAYGDRTKSRLYSFFMNPDSTIQKLNFSLISMNLPLSKYYDRNYQTIIDFQKQFNPDEFVGNFMKLKNINLDLNTFEHIDISICLLNKNCLKIFLNADNSIMILLGLDYKDYLSYKVSHQTVVELDEVGSAVSDKSRIEILDYILKTGEVSSKDIQQVFKLPVNTAYYHINLMSKANILKTRSYGKTLLYSVNREHFDAVIRHIKKYSNDPDGR